MKFDPTKKFGTVFGISVNHPGARYEQGGFVYNASHKCLNPDEATKLNQEDLVAEATKELKAKKASELAGVVTEVVAAQEAVNADGTAANKGKLTKIVKKHTALVAEIEAIGG